MTSLSSERSWLLDPSLLKLVHQCRRLIHSEFGIKLHLTEDHLERQLADYASKTRSSHLIRTWEELKPQIPNLDLDAGTDGKPASALRTYRGQAVAGTSSSGDGHAAADGEEGPRKKKIIYRGQVVG